MLVSLLTLVVTGCATGSPSGQRLVAASVPIEHKDRLSRIGLIEPAVPKHIVIGNPGRPSLGVLGLAFALAEHGVLGAVQGHRTSTFEQYNEASASEAQDEIQRRLAARLEAGLTAVGSAVRRLPRAPASGKGFLSAKEYLSAGGSVDAYLDVVVLEWGFVPAWDGTNSLWMPRVLADVRLVGADGKTVLFTRRLSNLMVDWRSGRFAVRAEHGFPTAKQVSDNAPAAFKGIEAAVTDLCGLCADALAVQASPLYIYRTSKGHQTFLSVEMDGKDLPLIEPKKGMALTVAPGPHTLRFGTASPTEISFTAEAGQGTYVKVDVHRNPFTGHLSGAIGQVPTPEGERAIRALK